MIVDVVFDGPPGPESGRFVEVELPNGTGVKVGEWLQRDDGYWVLRLDVVAAEPSITCPRCNRTSYHPEDIAQGYCGYCHWWTSDARLGLHYPEFDLERRKAAESVRRRIIDREGQS